MHILVLLHHKKNANTKKICNSLRDSSRTFNSNSRIFLPRFNLAIVLSMSAFVRLITSTEHLGNAATISSMDVPVSALFSTFFFGTGFRFGIGFFFGVSSTYFDTLPSSSAIHTTCLKSRTILRWERVATPSIIL